MLSCWLQSVLHYVQVPHGLSHVTSPASPTTPAARRHLATFPSSGSRGTMLMLTWAAALPLSKNHIFNTWPTIQSVYRAFVPHLQKMLVLSSNLWSLPHSVVLGKVLMA